MLAKSYRNVFITCNFSILNKIRAATDFVVCCWHSNAFPKPIIHGDMFDSIIWSHRYAVNYSIVPHNTLVPGFMKLFNHPRNADN